MSIPRVSFIRNELAAAMVKYGLITDCLIGEDAVKSRKARYLPMPNPEDDSDANRKRYESYVARALFVNFVQNTLNGLTGEVFAREPVSEIPDGLDVIEMNADGAGVSLVQTAKKALNLTLSKGRAGQLTDYPNTGNRGASVAEIQSGEVRPTITIYDPSVVINWRTKSIGAKQVLSLVVIAEPFTFFDDGFESKTACQFRVLKLDESNQYVTEIYRENSPSKWSSDTPIPNNKVFMAVSRFMPTNASGRPFNEIPFTFIGSENNDSSIDKPPMYDLANINIAHYRNSADYEESCFVVGQPTYWASGLSKDWVKDVMHDEFSAGSRGGVMLPVGGAAGILQPEPNSQAFEAMEHKEKLIVAIGGKFVEMSGGSTKTATEASHNRASETSFLATCANNVSAAIEQGLKWCAEFMGIATDSISYKLNTDFDINKLSPEARSQAIAEWQADAITFSELRAILRKANVATLDDKEAIEQIGKEREANLVDMKKEQDLLTIPEAAGKKPAPAKPTKAE